jgi:hypothetical protein
MFEFDQLDIPERERARRLAREWRAKHEPHVERLIVGGHIAYPPSGSDIFRPELWKPAMWRWLARQEIE